MAASVICMAHGFASEMTAGETETPVYELDMPTYTIIQKTPMDSVFVIFSHGNKEATIYANFTYSTDKLASEAVDTIRLPYWQSNIITAWAEVGDKRSYPVYVNLTKNPTTDLDPNDDTNNGIQILHEVIMQEHFMTGESYVIPPTGGDANQAEWKDWAIVSGNQDVKVDETKAVSAYIGADNGPIDIYSAGATKGALLFGATDVNDGQRAYIQSFRKIELPSVIDIYMQGDGKNDQQVVLQISDDGKAWASVDTLNTEQLKPIRRYQVLLQGDAPKYVRIVSATENGNNCETWIYDLAVISFVKKTSDALSQIDSCREIRSVEYYDLQGNRLSALPSGGIIIKIVRYTDESCDVEKQALF